MLDAPTRRCLITGLGAMFLAAPTIVRAGSLMPISGRCLAGGEVTLWPLTAIKIGDVVRFTAATGLGDATYVVTRTVSRDGCPYLTLKPQITSR